MEYAFAWHCLELLGFLARSPPAYVGPPGALLLGMSVWSFIPNVIDMISAEKLNSNPWEHKKWSKIILIFSIIGLGPLLGSIGGILALVYRPKAPIP